jgi:ABC-type lipoprotein export system ATPase subunit
MSDLLLSAKAIYKSYVLGKRLLEVLRGIDLDLRPGDFVALRGASGSGKSTLLHLLGGLDSPNQGSVWLAGRNLAELSSRELAWVRRRQVGFIFQAYYLLPELDALENVCLPARMARVPAPVAAARGRELLERVGLKDRMEHKPYELSGGEQQRVAIARSLINEPQLILADEPTGNLDSHTGEEIIDLLISLRTEKRTTLVMATHDAKLAAKAPSTITLVDGVVVGIDQPQNGPATGPPIPAT